MPTSKCSTGTTPGGILNPCSTALNSVVLIAYTLLGGCLSSDNGTNHSPEVYVDAGQVEPCITCNGSTHCTEVLEIQSALHVTIDITSDPPPAGGDHDPCWANYGVYDQPLPGRYWVHNLEHGAVVYLYNCPDGCENDIAALTTLTNKNSRALLTAYPYMTSRFAALSWGRRLLSDCLDIDVMAQFYESHVDRAPESIADGPPSSCTIDW